MSRLIVKNLPKGVTEQKIREVFGQKGEITDVQLKHKDGKFRKFGFVGYEKEESAAEAVKFFHNTFINTSKIQVEICAALGEETKTWKKKKAEDVPALVVKEEKPKKNKIEEIIGDHKNDPQFQEFMKVHSKDTTIWDNDLVKEKEQKDKEESDKSDSGSGSEEEPEKLANKDEISDLEYMKMLMKKPEERKEPKKEKKKKDMIQLFTIKIRNIPKKIKREELIKFFRPAKAFSVRIPTSGTECYAYVGFKNERDLNKALLKDKSFLNGKQVHVYDFTAKNKLPDQKEDSNFNKNPRWIQQEEMLKNQEAICDSGKLFFRNLAYTVTEDDVQKLFEPYGNIVEVNIPVDTVSRKIKGFGTVTFLMPEHAVKAYNELNGTLFHGRMFHILPGKSNDDADQDNENENSKNYKDKKEKELKKTAGSSHNWNTLFLGPNAVAEVLAKNFGKSKEEILDSAEGGSSAAVRLALGETQIVLEMKQFLEENDVHLDAFNESNKKRSKTVILVKNLPADTEVHEIITIFEKFGVLGRVLLPKSGVTALVEFGAPSEARKAFKKLAYTKFKHVPLYLEWAPENTFKTSAEIKILEKPSEEEKKSENSSEEIENEEEAKEESIEVPEFTLKKEKKKSAKVRREEKLKEEQKLQEELKAKEESEKEQVQETQEEETNDDPPEADTTLFIKNLNFKTNEPAVLEHFKHLGPIHIVQVARKKDPENPREQICLGYGFIQFKKSASAEKALKTMQFTEIEGKQIELKRSDRTLQSDQRQANRKQVKKKDQKDSTKIMVRNIPFQANIKEIRDIFKVFGEIKALRLPKKMVPGSESSSHRGFGFVDFFNKSEAKNAFDALHHSTHLYGRRLVLEWADADQDVEEIRKRTAEQFQGGSEPKKSRKSVFKTDHIKFVEEDQEDE